MSCSGVCFARRAPLRRLSGTDALAEMLKDLASLQTNSYMQTKQPCLPHVPEQVPLVQPSLRRSASTSTASFSSDGDTLCANSRDIEQRIEDLTVMVREHRLLVAGYANSIRALVALSERQSLERSQARLACRKNRDPTPVHQRRDSSRLSGKKARRGARLPTIMEEDSQNVVDKGLMHGTKLSTTDIAVLEKGLDAFLETVPLRKLEEIVQARRAAVDAGSSRSRIPRRRK